MKTQLPLRSALSLADKVAAAIEPGCERLAIAGSVRRGAAVVGDIEFVCIPRRGDGLFPGQPGPSQLDGILQELVTTGKLTPVKGGERMKQYTFGAMPELHLELWLVTPATWGVQLAIRTGPADFSRALVTERIRGGRLRDGHAVHDGRVWPPGSFMQGMVDGRDYSGPFFQPLGSPLETPEEQDFLELAGGWLEPARRRAESPVMDAREASST